MGQVRRLRCTRPGCAHHIVAERLPAVAGPYPHQPGQTQIQSDLFSNYQTNVAAYPAWQAWMRGHKPPMVVVWGKWDPSFTVGGAAAYKRDVPAAEVHILDAGHFALDEIAALMRGFLAEQKLGNP